MSNNEKRMLLFGLVSFVAIALGACREEEQGRILSFEPGKFLGTKPGSSSFNKAQMQQLRHRAQSQSGRK